MLLRVMQACFARLPQLRGDQTPKLAEGRIRGGACAQHVVWDHSDAYWANVPC